jgi:alpha-1,6-mannosyltransferase
MKVCDLTQSYAPTGGGVRTYLHEKQEFIRSHTSHEHVMIVPGTRDSVQRGNRTTVYTLAGWAIPNCHPYRFTLRLDKILSILATERPDVIECGTPYVLPFAAMLWRKNNRSVLVGFYHTDFPNAYVHTTLRKLGSSAVAELGKRMTDSYARFVYNRCNVTIASSKTMVERLRSIGVRNVALVPLGVDLSLFHPNRRDNTLRKELGLGSSGVLLIYAGRLDQEKRTHILLDAFERIGDEIEGVLVLVGNGPNRALVEAYASRNRKIRILPYSKERDQLARLLASGDIYVTAGPHETFGLSILEAQASGLAVVGVDAGALQDRVPARLGVLGRVDSVEDMTRNIIALAKDGFREKGKAARELVERGFSWQRTFDRLFRLYDRLRDGKI